MGGINLDPGNVSLEKLRQFNYALDGQLRIDAFCFVYKEAAGSGPGLNIRLLDVPGFGSSRYDPDTHTIVSIATTLKTSGMMSKECSRAPKGSLSNPPLRMKFITRRNISATPNG